MKPTMINFSKNSSPTTLLLRRKEMRLYNSCSFTTSTLDGGELSASRPGDALPAGKGPLYPLDRRMGGPYSWSGRRV